MNDYCDLCDGENNIIGEQMIYKNYENKYFLRIPCCFSGIDDVEYFEYTEIQYCPRCGHKLD